MLTLWVDGEEFVISRQFCKDWLNYFQNAETCVWIISLDTLKPRSGPRAFFCPGIRFIVGGNSHFVRPKEVPEFKAALQTTAGGREAAFVVGRRRLMAIRATGPATERQEWFLRRHGLWHAAMSKGRASEIIGRLKQAEAEAF
jgi:hypothetical protein